MLFELSPTSHCCLPPIRVGKFNKKIFHDILVNPVYKGVVKYDGKEYPGKHDALVRKEAFDRAQRQLERSGKEHYRTHITKSGLALLGTLKCGFCNPFMSETSTTKQNTGRKYYYYKCSTANHSTKEFCNSMDIPAQAIEEIALKLVRKFVAEPVSLDTCIKQTDVTSNGEIERLMEQKATIENNLSSIQKQPDNLSTRFTNDPDLLPISTLKKDLKELENLKSTLLEKLRQLESDMETKKMRPFDRKSFEYPIKRFDAVYPQLSTETKQKANRLVFKKIRSHVKRGNKEWIIEFKMRGDCKTVERWEELIKKKFADFRRICWFGSSDPICSSIGMMSRTTWRYSAF